MTLNKNILPSHLNKDGLHLNNCSTVKPQLKILSRGFGCFDVAMIPIENLNIALAFPSKNY